MSICFYNLAHIGDIYFSSLFINILCKCNKNIDFYYYFINGDIFFENISNIRKICPLDYEYKNKLINGDPPENLINDEIMKLLFDKGVSIGNQRSGSTIINYNNEDVLFINTWCASDYLQYSDYNIYQAIGMYDKLINKINIDYNLELKFHINNSNELIEHLHFKQYINIEKNNEKELQETIFIFNYVPRSLEFNFTDFNNNILRLSNNNKIILASYNSIFDNNENIKFFDKEYNIYPNPSCNNLIAIWEIALKCNKIIILNSGGCWTFLHCLKNIKTNQLYIANDIGYCSLLNTLINYILQENINLVNTLSLSNL